jgi:hypothetical protein
MVSMFARLIAASLVLVLVGPSVVAATCELTCAMGSHHHSAPRRHRHRATSVRERIKPSVFGQIHPRSVMSLVICRRPLLMRGCTLSSPLSRLRLPS